MRTKTEFLGSSQTITFHVTRGSCRLPESATRWPKVQGCATGGYIHDSAIEDDPGGTARLCLVSLISSGGRTDGQAQGPRLYAIRRWHKPALVGWPLRKRLRA